MALPVFPTVANGLLLPETSGDSPQFYVDYAAGVDSAPTSGAVGAPWKTLTYAVNTRLATGGANDRKGLGAFINVRTAGEQGGDLALDTSWNLGTSSTTQNRGGSITDPWTIRTAPEDVTWSAGNQGQGSGTQAKVGVKIDAYPSFSYVRWEHLDFTASRISTLFDSIKVEGGTFQQFFYCEMRNAPQNAVQFYGWNQYPNSCGCWGCLIHDNGDDVSGVPHDHNIYAGSGAGGFVGGFDQWAICCVLYRATGFGLHWYEAATRFLAANCTIDETCYPASVTQRGCIAVGGAPSISLWSRSCFVVNSILSTSQNSGTAYAIWVDQPGSPPASDLNEAHHNGYFVDCPNEDTRYANAITYGGNNVDADPQYVNRAVRNYHLLETSPMKAAGYSAYMPPSDFDGNAFLTNDIGAFAVPDTSLGWHGRGTP